MEEIRTGLKSGLYKGSTQAREFRGKRMATRKCALS